MRDLLRRHSFSITFLVILFASVFIFTNGGGEIQQLRGYTMGTTYQLQVVDMPTDISADTIADQVNALLTRLDTGLFSTYAPDSELSRFNRHPVNVPFIASAELLEVLQLSREIAVVSGGAFDVTVGPLVNLWGFGPTVGIPETVPSEESIASLLDLVDYRFLEIDASSFEIHKSRDIYVDLSGIAKGYAVDQLAIYFDELGVENYFLEIGGELKIKGVKPGNVSWVPAIEAPLDSESRVYEIFYSRGETIGVAGSGDYRNYFEEQGIRYSHEIDPRTGRPITHNLAAVYVIDRSTARADALATALLVMGADAGRELAERNDLAVYFIINSNGEEFSEYFTEGFSAYLGNR